MIDDPLPPGLDDALAFPLIEALTGRRSRRFALGAEIPDGVFAFRSDKPPLPLSELEKMLVLTACAGNTGWHYAIMRNARYAPHLSNYACAAGGRTFPSGAGFHMSELFFTDDEGVYLLQTRDAPELVAPGPDGRRDLGELLAAHRGRVRKLSDGRLKLPPEVPHVEGHNTWIVNCPGSLLAIPVADAAQYNLANICYYVQNGVGFFDDTLNAPIPGLARFSRLVDLDNALPITFMEQYTLAECTVEIATSCYAGALMLQAMGLGGWMFNGLNPFSVLGASGDPEVPGLGFDFFNDPRWPLPQVTGLPGVFEASCPPNHPDMKSAVDALCERKFGPGGPFHPGTPGAWKDSPRVRGAADIHDEEFRECVTLIADYILSRFGRFPGTIPAVYVQTYLQAQHLDLDFYDTFFKPGAYLQSHARHFSRWHGPDKGEGGG